MAFPMRTIVVLSLTILLATAGCVSNAEKKAEPEQTTADPIQPGDVDADSPYGVLQGYVQNSEELPIVGAEVRLRENDAQTKTDDDGLFQFIDLEPGLYTLDVVRLGYDAAARQVEIVAGQLQEITIFLEAIEEVKEGFSDITSFKGYYECALGAYVWVSACSYPYTAVYYSALDHGVNLTNYGLPADLQKNPFRYNFTIEENAKEVVSEMVWVPSSAASTKMMLVMSCGDYDPVLDDCSPQYGDVTGTSPLRIEWSASKISALPSWVMARGYLPFYDVQVALGQNFEIWDTVFYNTDAPKGYSVFNTA